MIRTLLLLGSLFAATTSAYADAERNAFLRDYLAGSYEFIGKGIDMRSTYFGTATIESTGEQMTMQRDIEGQRVTAVASIESATADDIAVLRVRFEQDGKQFEETCLIANDLDNYPRLTCHLYQPGSYEQQPGLEAFFARHKLD